jgi:hypothetical protein
MMAFGLFEQWPQRLPKWLARWALQLWRGGGGAARRTDSRIG